MSKQQISFTEIGKLAGSCLKSIEIMKMQPQQSDTTGSNRRRLVVAIDGDDTLWHNETLFVETHERFRDLLMPYVEKTPAEIDDLMLGFERKNLGVYGYGIKGFILSMVETAIEITAGAIAAGDIKRILDFGRIMLTHPVALIDGVHDVIAALKADGHAVWLITKGDLFDQEAKIARSGIVDHFDHIEIISEKDEATYQRILDRQGVAVADFIMAGNSLRSDILPVLEIGGAAFHVPYHVTWAHEVVKDHSGDGIVTLQDLGELPGKIREMVATD
jgi:putative hydrolase of the HAD superfamily